MKLVTSVYSNIFVSPPLTKKQCQIRQTS